MLNLAVNARDAMPSGGKLTIETANAYLDESLCAARQRGRRPASTSLMAVSDTGTGMTPRGDASRRSSRSSRPRTSARAPGSACRRSMASSSSRAATSRSTASPARARRSSSTCPAAAAAARRRRDGAAERATASPGGERAARPILVVEDDEDVRAHRGRDPARARLLACSRRRRRAARCACSKREPGIALLFTDVGLAGRHERPPARRRGAPATARSSGAVHDRLRAQRHRPPGPARPGRRADHQAVHVRGVARKVRRILERGREPMGPPL